MCAGSRYPKCTDGGRQFSADSTWESIEDIRERLRLYSTGQTQQPQHCKAAWQRTLPANYVLFAGADRKVTISPHTSGDAQLCHRWQRQGGRGDWHRYVCSYARQVIAGKSQKVRIAADLVQLISNTVT